MQRSAKYTVRLKHAGVVPDQFLEFKTRHDAEIFVHGIPFMQYVHASLDYMTIESALIIEEYMESD